MSLCPHAFTKSQDGGLPFPKYSISFSIRIPQNSASPVTFCCHLLLLLPQIFAIGLAEYWWRMALLVCFFSFETEAMDRSVALAITHRSKEVTAPHAHQLLPLPPHLPPAHFSWVSPKKTAPPKTMIIFCRISGADSPWSCKRCKEIRRRRDVGRAESKAVIFSGSP